MLRFFRNIRQKLIEQENVRKYIWYAIGEILLVVIGILIALQINNWNIDRQIRNEEINYLKNLKNDLQTDIQILNEHIEINQKNVVSTARLTARSEAGELGNFYDFIEDVYITMGSYNFTPSQNTFEEMRSSGKLSIISNEAIKQGLFELDEYYISIEDAEAHVRREYEIYLWDEFVNVVSYREYFELDFFRATADFDDVDQAIDSLYVEQNKVELSKQALEILANTRFQNGLFLYEFNYQYLLKLFKEVIVFIEELIEQIDMEIAA